MERQAIPGTDLEVSALCYGTAGLGTGIPAGDADALIDTFRDAGGNFLDTAHCYGGWAPDGEGASERAVGDYVRRNGKGDLVIATKGAHLSFAYYDHGDEWLTPERIDSDVTESLERLGLETIDLYYLHRDDLRKDVGLVIESLNEQVRAGRVRFIAASNWTVARIEAANGYAGEHGLQGFVASQVEWCLAHREPPAPQPHGTQTVFAGPDESAYHTRTGMPLVAFTSTGNGYFAPDTDKRADLDNATSRARAGRAQELAGQLGVTANQIALAWLKGQPFPVFPITGTSSPDHLREAAAAMDVRLTPEQVTWLAEG